MRSTAGVELNGVAWDCKSTDGYMCACKPRKKAKLLKRSGQRGGRGGRGRGGRGRGGRGGGRSARVPTLSLPTLSQPSLFDRP